MLVAPTLVSYIPVCEDRPITKVHPAPAAHYPSPPRRQPGLQWDWREIGNININITS